MLVKMTNFHINDPKLLFLFRSHTLLLFAGKLFAINLLSCQHLFKSNVLMLKKQNKKNNNPETNLQAQQKQGLFAQQEAKLKSQLMQLA